MVKVLLVTDDGRYLEGKRGRNNIKSHVNKFLFENELMEMEMKGTPLVFKKKRKTEFTKKHYPGVKRDRTL